MSGGVTRQRPRRPRADRVNLTQHPDSGVFLSSRAVGTAYTKISSRALGACVSRRHSSQGSAAPSSSRRITQAYRSLDMSRRLDPGVRLYRIMWRISPFGKRSSHRRLDSSVPEAMDYASHASKNPQLSQPWTDGRARAQGKRTHGPVDLPGHHRGLVGLRRTRLAGLDRARISSTFLARPPRGRPGVETLLEDSRGTRLHLLSEMHPLLGVPLGPRQRPVGMRGLLVQTAQGRTRGDPGMDERCDVAILALALVAAACLVVFFLKVGQPSGGIVEMLFPHL